MTNNFINKYYLKGFFVKNFSASCFTYNVYIIIILNDASEIRTVYWCSNTQIPSNIIYLIKTFKYYHLKKYLY